VPKRKKTTFSEEPSFFSDLFVAAAGLFSGEFKPYYSMGIDILPPLN
jgi:hypothetical protein